jgi:uncharacterized membrane protein YdbT with pleckstrin-like domain
MIDKIQALLTENERILEQGRIHEIVIVPPLFYTFLGILAWLFFHPVVGFVIFFLTLYPWYNAIIHYKMTYLILTNKKVMCREGFLTRDWIRMDFDRIENAYLEEPIIGRYLGYATVIVSGVGQGAITVSQVRNGDNFVKALEKQLAKSKGEKR